MTKFTPQDWLPRDEDSSGSSSAGKAMHPDRVRDVERVLEALEEQQLDITAEYHVWLRLGFALAHGFGEAGREYFQRVSRFYPGYKYAECDQQYSRCLRSKGSGITLSSFFHYAREAGIRCSGWEPEYDPTMEFSEDASSVWLIPPTGEAPEWAEIPEEVYREDFIPGSRVGGRPPVATPSATPSEEELQVARLEQAWNRWCEQRGTSSEKAREWADKWIRDPQNRQHAEEVLRKAGRLPDADPDPQESVQLSEATPQGNTSGESAAPEDDRGEELRMMEEEKWRQANKATDAPSSETPAEEPPISPEAPAPQDLRDPRELREALPPASEEKMPSFPDRLFQQLPEFLQKAVAPATSPEERDLLLLGTLGAASACFPKLKGLYDSKEYRPNLYLFVAAQASAGKGKLAHCKQLVEPLHQKLREQAELLKLEYEQELAEFDSGKAEKEGKRKPRRPAERMLFLPANNSASGMIQLLADNQGQGLIFESEGDTLTQSLRTDFSDYSDSFRKAFHHEGISYFRKTDREYICINTPCLSTVISGTPKQVVALIRNVEDGLFSRFIFYSMNVQPGFREVFAKNPHGNLDAYFLRLGEELLSLHQVLMAQPELWVELSEEQIQRFYTFFRRALARYRQLKPREYDATVNRLGLIAFRLCMLLTAFRIMEDGQAGEKRLCSDTDFESVLCMVSVLFRHSSRMFSLLPEETKLLKKESPKEQFLERLAAEFSRKEYLELAASLKIKEKSAEAYITDFVKSQQIERTGQGHYKNLQTLNP